MISQAGGSKAEAEAARITAQAKQKAEIRKAEATLQIGITGWRSLSFASVIYLFQPHARRRHGQIRRQGGVEKWVDGVSEFLVLFNIPLLLYV